MLKLLATVVFLLGSLLAHADTASAPSQLEPVGPGSTIPNAPDGKSQNLPPTPYNNDNLEGGDSNDVDPINDLDPEADVPSDDGSPPAQQTRL